LNGRALGGEPREPARDAEHARVEAIFNGDFADGDPEVARREQTSSPDCDTRLEECLVVIEGVNVVAQLSQAALGAGRNALPQHLCEVQGRPDAARVGT